MFGKVLNVKSHNNNVYVRIVEILVIVAVVILIMFWFFGTHANRSVQDRSIEVLNMNLKFYAESFEEEVSEIIAIQNLLKVDPKHKKYFVHHDVISNYDKYELSNDIIDFYTKFLSLNDIIHDIGVFDPKKERIVSYRNGNNYPKYFQSIDLSQECLLRNVDKHLFVIQQDEREDGLVYFVEIAPSKLQHISESIANIVELPEIALVQCDTILYSTDNWGQDDNILKVIYTEEEQPLHHSEEATMRYKDQILFTYNILNDKTKLVVDVDDDIINAQRKLMNQILTMVIFVTMLLFIIFIIVANNMLNKPLEELVNLMEEVEKGNYSVEVKRKHEYQFEYLFTGFQRMLHSLKENISKNYEQKMVIERSQLKQLQSQINPHFLYNCFFNIRNLCKVDDSETAMKLSHKLAQYYMYITRNKKDIVYFKDEYQHAIDYLDIQKLRFHDRVTVEISGISTEIEHFMVPKIILQPILENAYKYVFERIEIQGVLRIDIKYVNGNLSIAIEDNGVITDDATIKSLDSCLLNMDSASESTGIINTMRRLRLFNKDNSIRASRSELGGMKIELNIMRVDGDIDV